MISGLRVTDALAFVGESLYGDGISAEQLLRGHRALGVDGVVLAPPRDPDYAHRSANDRVAAIVRQDPGTRRQLGRVDPNHRDSLAEVARCADDLGVAGFFLSPREENFAIDGIRAAPLLESIAERGVPLVSSSRPECPGCPSRSRSRWWRSGIRTWTSS